MAKLPSGFAEESEKYGEMGDFTPLPKGDYNVKIVESDYVQNSKKTGHFLKLVREVTSPAEYAGRKIYSNLNLDNPNPQAVELANKEWNSTKKACGKVIVEDSEELHGIEHTITLAVKKGIGDEPDENKTMAIKPLEGAATPDKPAAKSAGAAAPTGPKKRKTPIFEDDEE